MSIDFRPFEIGLPLDEDYASALSAVQVRLTKVQAAYSTFGANAIILIEGWSYSGVGRTMRRITQAWHPRGFRFVTPRPIGGGEHFLRSAWLHLPEAGHIALFDRGWYHNLYAASIAAGPEKDAWRRGLDEINEFEAQQHDHGTPVIKIFLHLAEDEHRRRYAEACERAGGARDGGVDGHANGAMADPHAATAPRSLRMDLLVEAFEATDTRWAPWTLVDANHPQAGRIAALRAVADALERHVVPREADAVVVGGASSHQPLAATVAAE